MIGYLMFDGICTGYCLAMMVTDDSSFFRYFSATTASISIAHALTILLR